MTAGSEELISRLARPDYGFMPGFLFGSPLDDRVGETPPAIPRENGNGPDRTPVISEGHRTDDHSSPKIHPRAPSLGARSGVFNVLPHLTAVSAPL